MTLGEQDTQTRRRAEVAAMFARHGPSYRAWGVITVMLGTVSAVMEATIVNVAMPEIIRVFHLGHDRVQLLSTGFLAATTASMLLSHWAIGRFGIRSTYISALCLLMVFSVLASLTSIDQFALLAACRIAQGVIAGLIQPLAMLVIVDLFPPDERGRAMSAYGLGIVLSPAVGPVAGGLLVDHFGWRAVFLVTLPLCLAAVALAPRFMILGRPAPHAPKLPLDLLGLTLLCAALVALLGGLAALFEAPGGAIPAIGIGLLLSLGFVVWQRAASNASHPLLDLRIFRIEGFAAAMLLATAYGMGIYGSTYLVPLFAQSGAGFSAFEAGSMLVPGGVMLALVLLVSGGLADRFPANRVAMAGLACFAASALLLGLSSRSTGFWLLALWVTLGRVGLGLIIPGLNAGALGLLPVGSEPAGAAAINFFRQLGGALGVTLLALFIEWRQRSYAFPPGGAIDETVRAAQGLSEGFFIIAAVYALALLPAWHMAATPGPRPS